jgi:hypothetical protein
MEGVTVITAIIAGVLLIAVIGLTIEILHQRSESDYWRGLHRELLGVANDIQKRHNALLKYRHVQKIVANIEAGKARKK